MGYEFAGYEVEVPFGPAPGAITGLSEELIAKQIREVLRSPVGAVWGGSFTSNRNEGNLHYGRVFYHKRSTGQTVNSNAFPNIGKKAAIRLWPGLTHMAENEGKVLIPSVAYTPNEDPLKVLPQLAYDFLAAGAHGVEVDYSCPNHVLEDGKRAPMIGHDPDKLHIIRSEVLKEIGLHQVYLEKLPAYEGEKRSLIPLIIADLLKAAGISYVSIPNSIENQYLLDENGKRALDVPGNIGGLSGPATAEIGREHLKIFRELLPKHIGIVSCDGVASGEEVYRRVHDLKADFTAGVTVYLKNEEDGISFGQTSVSVANEFADKLTA